ncbi:hypothetical protein [Brachybacterium phenoliresistens]|uniref:hypothetical protein n=1 Tax=Brachybacterium phenoliresistens TaxID=396014 RepID=UPI0031DFB976
MNRPLTAVPDARRVRRRTLLFGGSSLVVGALMSSCGPRSRDISRTVDLPWTERLCGLRVDDGVLTAAIPECNGAVWYSSTRIRLAGGGSDTRPTWWGLGEVSEERGPSVLGGSAFRESDGSYDTTLDLYVDVRSQTVGRIIQWVGVEEAHWPEDANVFLNGAGESFELQVIAKGGETCEHGDGALFG